MHKYFALKSSQEAGGKHVKRMTEHNPLNMFLFIVTDEMQEERGKKPQNKTEFNKYNFSWQQRWTDERSETVDAGHKFSVS